MKIRLMADYGSWPLWHNGGGEEVGNINPEELPISEKLKNRLLSWADTYDNTLEMDDPASSGFKSSEDAMAFKDEARQLLKDLQEELGENYEVSLGYLAVEVR